MSAQQGVRLEAIIIGQRGGDAPDGSYTAPDSKSASAPESKSASAPGDALPLGWEEAKAPDGNLFYINHANKRTQWERPSTKDGALAHASDESWIKPPKDLPDLPEGWSEGIAPDGQIYYLNNLLKTTQWDIPTEPANVGIDPSVRDRAINAARKRVVRGHEKEMSYLVKGQKQLFNKVDTNNDQVLSREELFATLRDLAQYDTRLADLSQHQRNIIYEGFDRNPDGSIDIHEYLFVVIQAQLEHGDRITPEEVLARMVGRILDMQAARDQSSGAARGAAGEGKEGRVDMLGVETKGQGCARGCAQMCGQDLGITFCTSFFEVTLITGLLLALLLENDYFWIMFGCGYFFYFLQIAFCVRVTGFLANTVQGTQQLVEQMERVYAADLSYTWHIECYHYETRTRTVTDGEGNSHTETYQVKVVTHRASRNGNIRSTDHSPKYAPDTSVMLLQLCSTVGISFAPGDYKAKMQTWRVANTRDTHQDFSNREFVKCHRENVLVEWVPGSRPCWMTAGWYWLSNLFLASLVYRCAFNARCGRQNYEFKKVATNIY